MGPASAKAVVWRVEDLNGDGDAMDDGEVEPFVTGLTTVTDITFGPDGTLYIAEFSSDTRAVFQEGDFGELHAAVRVFCRQNKIDDVAEALPGSLIISGTRMAGS